MIGYTLILSCVWCTHDKKDDINILFYLVFGSRDMII